MKNTTLGKIGSAVTGLAVLSFAISMIFGLFLNWIFVSCLSSIFIAIGFIPFMAALNENNDKQNKSCGVVAMCFASIYAVLVFIVYYAECTTVHMNTGLSEEVLSIISYGNTGSLFFNYDLLGYAFMALSTFFTGLNIKAVDKKSKCLKILLMVHGIFFVSCFFVPMFPVFTSGTDDIFGTILLEVWCIYFLPICILGYKCFSDKKLEK